MRNLLPRRNLATLSNMPLCTGHTPAMRTAIAGRPKRLAPLHRLPDAIYISSSFAKAVRLAWLRCCLVLSLETISFIEMAASANDYNECPASKAVFKCLSQFASRTFMSDLAVESSMIKAFSFALSNSLSPSITVFMAL